MTENEHHREASPDQGPVLPDVARALTEQFHVRICFAPDHLSPPVDAQRLAQFLRDELPSDEAEEICHLIGSFRPWYDACTAILRRRLDDAT